VLRNLYRRHWRAVLLLLLVVGVLVARRPGQLVFPQFWAEDAALFYVDAEMYGTASLWRPYAGYWHVIPRAVALAGTALPVRHLPTLYVLSAFVITACTAWLLMASDFARSRLAGFTLAAALVSAPFTGEIWLVLANVQWVAAVALLVGLGANRPRSNVGRWLAIGAVALTGLTGPFALLFLPCVVLRVSYRRDAWSWTLLAVLLLCAILTWLALANHTRSAIEPLWQRAGVIAAHLRYRLVLSITCLAAVTMLLGALVLGHRRRDVPLVTTAGSGVLLLASVVFTMPLSLLAVLPHQGGRYLLLPWTLTVWVLVMLLERGVRWPWVPLAVAALVTAYGFRLEPLARYDWPRDAHCLETEWQCRLTVNPEWTFVLPGRPQTARP
jgi:hypothetical protein